ncbi:molybdate ABC transporter substrate-binding protein [Leptospira tipperaryensis]|uniref:Molybdate ABC transporter substrate-binding protein n=1 Tax=Leptospira tipperaryensis TaxID=2564040 RepID=A0A1D7UVJ6_9LEPT|nr:molybdate ABC transporter substrate-binding protein [Leptospira tipperaryensis]AOP33564.1 molybdate ABC transporter substrate-binding protein [Leptospira tipperaryensis]
MQKIKIIVLFWFLSFLSPIFGETKKQIIVSAASSLTQAFTEIGEAFEKKHSTKVFFNFAASGVLLQQIENGAPADVFASADQETVEKGSEKKLFDLKSKKNFVGNRLILVVPADRSSKIQSLSDLKEEFVQRIALGNVLTVPAGRYAKEVLEKEGIYKILEGKLIPGENVRQVLDYVARGEVEAGFVYKTDAMLMKENVKIAVADLKTRPILYPVVIVSKTSLPKESKLFVEFLFSPEAQKIFQKFHFAKGESNWK